MCAALRSPRRGRAALRTALDNSLEEIDDAVEMERWARQFHSELINGCGNEALILVAGTVEQLWSRQSAAWTYRVSHAEDTPATDLRKRGLEEHRAIVDAIEAGDAELAEKLFREHVRDPEIYSVRQPDARVRATDIAWDSPTR